MRGPWQRISSVSSFGKVWRVLCPRDEVAGAQDNRRIFREGTFDPEFRMPPYKLVVKRSRYRIGFGSLAVPRRAAAVIVLASSRIFRNARSL